jgi:crotonobetainyl-CoA:carnitine CoA-transferase CaiB-like acyl-CoA transferase
MLSHLRVLDLTDGASGIAGRMLADLGADVILIEPPTGAPSRSRAPFANGNAGQGSSNRSDPERSLEFWANNRGKRSVVLDLERPTDRERLRALVASADVWIDDAPVGRLADLGLGYAELATAQPALVHASITPFGEIGPKSQWAATDLTVTASSQAMWMTGDADRAPLTCTVPQAFFHAGAEAAAAIMIALAERDASGLGQHIDVSAQTAMMASCQAGVLAHGWNDRPLSRSGGGVGVGPYRLRFIYECIDGYVNFTLLFGEPIGHATARFFAWMDEEGYSNDALRAEDWVGYGAKIFGQKMTVEEHEAVMQAIERFTRTKTKAELFAAAFERKLLIVPLSDASDLFHSAQLASRAFWTPVKHSSGNGNGEVSYPGPFARFSATPIQIERPPPQLAEHDNEILDTSVAKESIDDSISSPVDAKERALPLAGLKVLDFTWVYAGPAITRQLADYGATVVKVESSTAPDALRANGPFRDGQPGGDRSANFSSVNLGKLSLGLNMKVEEAREVVLRLVDWADVVIENFSPRAMKSWGLDYARLRERKPEIIMLSTSLSGGTGPESSLAGYGTMGSALAGFGFVTGWPDRRPAAPYMAYTDYVAPRFAVTALLAALDVKRRTGVGQQVDLSQAECTIHFLGPATLDYSVNQNITTARGNASLHYAPSGVYPAHGEDRWVAIAATNDFEWDALASVAAATSGSDWTQDARFATNDARIQNQQALDDAIATWSVEFDVGEIEERLQEVGVPVHRVTTSRDAFEDPQLIAREHFIPVDHPVLESMPFENSRVRFSATPAQPRPCPTLGQHNAFVLEEVLGYSEAEITDLVIAGAIE